MSSPMTADEVLDREYLELRARILQLSACFDRLDRSKGEYRQDPRLGLIQQGLDLVADASCRVYDPPDVCDVEFGLRGFPGLAAEVHRDADRWRQFV